MKDFKIVKIVLSVAISAIFIGCGGDSSSSEKNSNETRGTTTSNEEENLNQSEEIENSTLSNFNIIWLTPSKNVCEKDKESLYIDGYGCYAKWKNIKKICQASSGVVPTIENLKKVVVDCGGGGSDYFNNVVNESYQDCYQQEGFSSYNTYWSSSTYVSDSDNAWRVNFLNGANDWTSKENYNYIQCISN